MSIKGQPRVTMEDNDRHLSADAGSTHDQFTFQTSIFSFSLAQWARGQASCLLTKSLKDRTKDCPGQAKFESYLSQRQAEIQDFF